jgi:hypothetical protein
MNNFSGNHLHIVSFNVPYPPDYGGVIDVFYKIKALSELGIKIYLHCFTYGREQSEELNKYCEKVYYYPRKKFYQAIYASVPYIVGSRKSDELLSNLTADNHPILFEGLHTCFYLNHPALKDKLKAVRMHNVEWDYYRSLKDAERNYLIKFYFYYESKKLKTFEDELKFADKIFAISKSDYEYLRQQHENIFYAPAFHSNETITSKPGKGDYVLYHGNLSVVENNQAALFIIKKIAEGMDVQFKIAGKAPLSTLTKEVKKYGNIELIANPSFEKISELVANAQINLLPTFQPTGIKLKLLNALYRGRFCIVNSKMVNNNGLEPLCIVEDNPNVTKRLITDLMQREFTTQDISQRESILTQDFSNLSNASKMATEIFGVAKK